MYNGFDLDFWIAHMFMTWLSFYGIVPRLTLGESFVPGYQFDFSLKQPLEKKQKHWPQNRTPNFYTTVLPLNLVMYMRLFPFYEYFFLFYFSFFWRCLYTYDNSKNMKLRLFIYSYIKNKLFLCSKYISTHQDQNYFLGKVIPLKIKEI